MTINDMWQAIVKEEVSKMGATAFKADWISGGSTMDELLSNLGGPTAAHNALDPLDINAYTILFGGGGGGGGDANCNANTISGGFKFYWEIPLFSPGLGPTLNTRIAAHVGFVNPFAGGPNKPHTEQLYCYVASPSVYNVQTTVSGCGQSFNAEVGGVGFDMQTSSPIGTLFAIITKAPCSGISSFTLHSGISASNFECLSGTYSTFSSFSSTTVSSILLQGKPGVTQEDAVNEFLTYACSAGVTCDSTTKILCVARDQSGTHGQMMCVANLGKVFLISSAITLPYAPRSTNRGDPSNPATPVLLDATKILQVDFGPTPTLCVNGELLENQELYLPLKI